MEEYAKKSVWKWILIYGAAAVLVYGVIYFAFFYKGANQSYSNQTNDQNTQVQQTYDQTPLITLINETSDWKTYTSDNHYFSVLWGPGWKIEVNSMGITLTGKEGGFNIAWNGLGGMCDEDKTKQYTTGEDFYWICGEETDDYYHYSVNKTSNSDIAIGVISKYSGTTDIDKTIFLKVLRSIKLNSLKEIMATSSCDEMCIKTFSPDKKYALLSRGTSPERSMEIIEIDSGKSIATFNAYSRYGWLSNDFIFEEPQDVSQKDMRPWGSGEGTGISKINLQTGQRVALQKSDSTHDYSLEINPDGSLVGSQGNLWIDIKTYANTGGDEKFLHPSISSWIMDYNGKLISNVTNFENY